MIGNKASQLAVLGVVIWAGLCYAQETEIEYSRERYDVIVERSPFGADPLSGTEVADKQAAATLKTLEKELRLCFLLEDQSGAVRAGFQNIKAKPGEPKSIMLMAGESFRAMKLLEIDIENSTATLQYQGKPLTFELSKDAKAARAATKKPEPQKQPQRRFGGGFRRRTPPAEEEQAVLQAQPNVPEESPDEVLRRREEVRKNLEAYQMEIIRSGMPPLPMPLTEEMDAQLVEEGVLPPIEEGEPIE
jgi:hypothetical protein